MVERVKASDLPVLVNQTLTKSGAEIQVALHKIDVNPIGNLRNNSSPTILLDWLGFFLHLGP